MFCVTLFPHILELLLCPMCHAADCRGHVVCLLRGHAWPLCGLIRLLCHVLISCFSTALRPAVLCPRSTTPRVGLPAVRVVRALHRDNSRIPNVLRCALLCRAVPAAVLGRGVLQGNALGKGPVLFCFGAKGLRRLAAAAASGDPAFQQLELDMYRLAGETSAL